jgi:hypothetical protein
MKLAARQAYSRIRPQSWNVNWFASILPKTPSYMNMPGWDFHPLTANLADHYSVSVNGNWRMTFTFEGEDAVLVDYQDYH